MGGLHCYTDIANPDAMPCYAEPARWCHCHICRDMFLRAGGTEACQDIAQQVLLRIRKEGAGLASGTPSAAVGGATGMRERLMQRRADGMRWQALVTATKRSGRQEGERLLQACMLRRSSGYPVMRRSAFSVSRFSDLVSPQCTK